MRNTGKVLQFPRQEQFKPPTFKLQPERETEVYGDCGGIVISQVSADENPCELMLTVSQARRLSKAITLLADWYADTYGEDASL